jgi:hypothetical protein
MQRESSQVTDSPLASHVELPPKSKWRRKDMCGIGSQVTITTFPARCVHRLIGDGHCPAGLIRQAIEEVCRKPGVVVYTINDELKEWLRGTFIGETG